MSTMSRRKMLQLLTASPAAGFAWTETEARVAHGHAQAAKQAAAKKKASYKPKFFTAHEYATVTLLADLIIPKDERSGSASDAGVPEFMDFMMADQPIPQTAMRGGLAWLDLECQKRFDKTFLDCSDADRRAVLDDIAWPSRAKAELTHGVSFFNSFRDLTATGFWTSKMGIEDLQYQGNTFVAEWKGCPEEALTKLGVAYRSE